MRTIWSIPLTLCTETEPFHLEQSFVAQPKQRRRATELLVHLRVKTHERTLKHTSLWLGWKTQRFSGTNHIPEQLRPFGTSLVEQCPQELFRPDLKSTHSPWVFEDALRTDNYISDAGVGRGSFANCTRCFLPLRLCSIFSGVIAQHPNTPPPQSKI